MWSGLLANIPNGWLLCDGTSGTPDLREQFIRGTPDGIDPGDTGGAAIHDHDFVSNGHFHDIPAGSKIGAGANYDEFTDFEQVVGTSGPASSLPPYYNLAFLMKS